MQVFIVDNLVHSTPEDAENHGCQCENLPGIPALQTQYTRFGDYVKK